MPVNNSRLEGLYRLTCQERLEAVAQKTGLSESEKQLLTGGGLPLETANHMIENVVGLFPLPFAIASNFIINHREYLIPMVVEEPSIVAAASFMAKLTRDSGGFITSYSGPLMIAQIHVINVGDPYGARIALLENKDHFLEEANQLDRTLVSMGGGAQDIEVRVIEDSSLGPIVALHLIVDVRDAMGANAVNTMAERLAAHVEKITGGIVVLRILSNLADRRLARARVSVPPKALETAEFSGEFVAEGIVRAYRIADADPYRATTHNKGIMNGIDPIVVATGNDWRAIEAGAHAYAARSGRYRSLTTWERDHQGNLVGTLELPMAVGIVGGATKTHPLAQLSLKILGVETAAELAQIIVAVGLAQNMAALRVLSTEGVQRGHMELHARNIVIQAGIPAEARDWVVDAMVQARDVRVDRAKELFSRWQARTE
ncbi:MAG: hydroxymethylglutaryl-CoA reductase, degradative [Firmicutes bacterium]|nr:hydroxymethylglutaryl-CoA reductase, degradative [Bacillota bacterium]